MYWCQCEGNLKRQDQDSRPIKDESWLHVTDCLVRMRLDVKLIRKPKGKGAKRSILWWRLPYRRLGQRKNSVSTIFLAFCLPLSIVS